MSQRRTGFTLIELLVVIAIIGILATLVVVAVNGAQVRARNSQAKNDVTQMGKAIELFKVNQNATILPSVTTGTGVLNSTLNGTTGARILAVFTGSESASTYGAKISTTPTTAYTYTYYTNAGQTPTGYSLWTNVVAPSGGTDYAFCVMNGASLSGSAAGTVPTGCDTPPTL